MAKRNIHKTLASKIAELEEKGGKEISEKGKLIRQRVHNTIHFGENGDVIDKEDQQELLDFLQDEIDEETDKSRKENLILISAVLRQYFYELEKSGSYPKYGKY